MTTILIIAGAALLFVIVFLIVFAAAMINRIKELETVINNLTIEIATVGVLAADAKFAGDDLDNKMENLVRYGVWE